MREGYSLQPKEYPSRTLPKKGGWEELHLFPAHSVPAKQKAKLIPRTPTEKRLGESAFCFLHTVYP